MSAVQHRVLDPQLQERHELRISATTVNPMAVLVEAAAGLVRQSRPGCVTFAGPVWHENDDSYVLEVFMEDAQWAAPASPVGVEEQQ